MADEIQKLDLSNAAEQIRDKIKLAFIDLIPDEQWKAMIQGEIKKFMEHSSKKDGYGGWKNAPSEFSVIAQRVLVEHMDEQLKKRIAATDYLPDGKTMEMVIQAWLDENHQTVLSGFLEEMMSRFSAAIIASGAQLFTSGFAQKMLNDPLMQPNPNNPTYNMRGDYIGG